MFPEGPEGAGSQPHLVPQVLLLIWGGCLVRAPRSQRPMCVLLQSPPAHSSMEVRGLCLLMTSLHVCAGLARPAGCLSRGPSGARGLASPAFLLST